MNFTVLFLLPFLVASSGAQQRESALTLKLGAVELRSGMQKGDVIARLTEAGFELQELGNKLPRLPEDTEEWNVGHKNTQGILIPNGIVDFQAGVLWRAGKVWYGIGAGSIGDSDADLAEALYGLARVLKDEHLAPCSLDTQDNYSADLAETKHVVLVCGGKILDISIDEVEPSQAAKVRPGVNVWEYLALR